MYTTVGPNQFPSAIVENFGVREIAVDLPEIRRGVRVRMFDSDAEIFRQVFIEQDYDHPMPEDARIVVDAGANVGYASLWFGHRFPQAQVISIEPDHASFRQLLANCSGIARFSQFEGALWPHDTGLNLITQDENGAPLSAMARRTEAGTGDGRVVPGLSVASLMTTCGIDHIDIFKIDIEGSERELFGQGDLAWIDHVRCIIVELHDDIRPGASAAVYDALPEHRFRRSVHGENVYFHRLD